MRSLNSFPVYSLKFKNTCHDLRYMLKRLSCVFCGECFELEIRMKVGGPLAIMVNPVNFYWSLEEEELLVQDSVNMAL